MAAGDPILFTFKHYPRTQIREQNYEYKKHLACLSAKTKDSRKSRNDHYGTGFIHSGTENPLTEWIAGLSAQLGPWRGVGDGIQNEVYPPETGGANWKFWVTYNHGEWVRGPWNTTGGYWTPGVPGLGYSTISDVQRHFACLFGPYSTATGSTSAAAITPQRMTSEPA